MKTGILKPYTGSAIIVCTEWTHPYFPKQSELIDILHAHSDYGGYDYSKCLTSSLIIDRDHMNIYYDICPASRMSQAAFSVQEPEFYNWHKVRAYIKSDTEVGFHPNEVTTEEGQRKFIRRYFTENCLSIAKSHFGAIRNLKHEIRDQSDGTFFLTVEYEAKFEGSFAGFFG